MNEEVWRERAVCAGSNDYRFFGNEDEQREAVEAFCVRCSQREICLQNALDEHEKYGVQGGMTEDERRRYIRRLRDRRARERQTVEAA